jgi:transposase-like protein
LLVAALRPSSRDVEELPAECGIDADHVTVDRWWVHVPGRNRQPTVVLVRSAMSRP